MKRDLSKPLASSYGDPKKRKKKTTTTTLNKNYRGEITHTTATTKRRNGTVKKTVGTSRVNFQPDGGASTLTKKYNRKGEERGGEYSGKLGSSTKADAKTAKSTAKTKKKIAKLDNKITKRKSKGKVSKPVLTYGVKNRGEGGTWHHKYPKVKGAKRTNKLSQKKYNLEHTLPSKPKYDLGGLGRYPKRIN